jgi:HEAT repeat protein
MSKHTFSLICCLCAVTPLAGFAQVPDGQSLTARLKAYHYGADASALDATYAEVAAARADPTHRAALARQLAAVLSGDASFEAKQFACRQLAFVATEEQIPALSGLLSDDVLAHYALMALTRIPGSAVDAALRNALPHSHGRPEMEIMYALADRGDMQAVPELLSRLASPDPATADAAASALAKLATPAAIQGLRHSYTGASGARRLSFGYALLDGADRLRLHGDIATAATVDTLLEGDAANPALSAAALRGLARARSAEALPRIVKALGEDGTPRQAIAAGLARELPGAHTTQVLSGALPQLTVRGKLLLLSALSDRGDHAAAAAVKAQCGAADASVRVAALHALGAVGDATCVSPLLEAASKGPAEERDAARDSLTLLRGAAVDTQLLAALDTATPPLRAEIVTQLGQRHTAGALPRLLREARGQSPIVRTAALRVLRDMGQPDMLPALVDLLLATPPADRDAAIDTVSEIARRGASEQQRTGVLTARLAAVSQPADKIALLTLLGQVGGSSALTALRSALDAPNDEVRATALSLLGDWPTDEPLEDLHRAVSAAKDDRQRTLALRGYLRMIGANEARPTSQTLALYREVAPLATRADERRLLLAGLAKTRSLEALEFANGFVQDTNVRAEAEAAVVTIGASTLGAWPDKTRAALAPIAQNGVNDEARKQAGAVLARLDRMGDFIPAWEVSPAYQQDGVDYTRLFDLAFAPEEAGHEKQVPWQPMPIGTDPDHPWLLDLLALWGGEQRVAYLRTAIWSDTARDMVLELGSDDGVKAWWNGQVVLAHNVARAVAPAEEKVTVALKPGWNTLQLKVTQNNQGWGACARFTAPNGAPATGIRYAIPSAIENRQ